MGSDILGTGVKPAGPIEAATVQEVSHTAAPPVPPQRDMGREFTALLATHYAEVVAFARDLLSGAS